MEFDLLIKNANDLLNDFLESNDDNEKWQMPFPMGVFGTLRRRRGNDYLMGQLEGSEYSHARRDVSHIRWSKAFLPHFYPSGLTLYHKQNATGPFEIYFFDPKNWNKMIPSVESLEGFRPCSKEHYGYHRTLVMLNVLPDNFKHPQRDSSTRWNSHELEIPKDDWSKYPTVPAWVYSNCNANNSSLQSDDTSIIWTGIR